MDRTLTRRRLIGKAAALAAVAPLAALTHVTETEASSDALVLREIPPQWNREPSIHMGWGFPYVGNIMEASMLDAADELAIHWGWMNDTIECDTGEMLPCTSDEDVVRALLQPIPLAIAYHDLCVGSAVAVPELVQRAFDILRPQVFGGAS